MNKPKNAPIISFLTPVYNGESYIERCIDSVLSQGSNYDFELLVIDDGSTDKTGELLRNYALRDKRIRFLSQDNLGYVGTMNRLIALAKGAYIYSVDADNWIPDYLLANAINILQSKEYDFVQYDLELIAAGASVQETKEIRSASPQKLFTKLEVLNAMKEGRIYLASHGGKFIRSDIAKRFMFHGNPTGSDRRWLGQILAVSSRGMVCSNVGLFVEMRKESISKKNMVPLDHVRYSQEMLDDIEFYRTLKPIQKQGGFPQLIVCFDHYYQAVREWTWRQSAFADSQVIQLGQKIWCFRNLIFHRRLLSKKKFSIWLICNFPKIYTFLQRKLFRSFRGKGE